jgi:glycosyltransferase involved in cell wall biosynthesis
MISFIVPAHNEQACLGRTLLAIHDSARAVEQPYEIIVVNDASTDSTAEIAQQHNAIVLPVNHRQIAATRNSGARAAHGDRFIFVDADTTISARVMASALQAMDKGAVGGGALVKFEGDVPLYMHLLLWWLGWFMRLAGLTGGAFMFCTREAFRSAGGFDERLFGAEDAAMSWALKREGRFVVLWKTVSTSGRRVRGIKGLQMLTTLVRMAFFPGILKQRSTVKKVWYDSNREEDVNTSNSFLVQIINFVLLLILLIMITGPLWNLVPWSWTPEETLIGKVRLGIAIFSCHVGLFAWPCAYFLFRNLLRQKRWIERIKLTGLTVLALWCAWGATPVVLWFWPWLYHYSLAQFFPP